MPQNKVKMFQRRNLFGPLGIIFIEQEKWRDALLIPPPSLKYFN